MLDVVNAGVGFSVPQSLDVNLQSTCLLRHEILANQTLVDRMEFVLLTMEQLSVLVSQDFSEAHAEENVRAMQNVPLIRHVSLSNASILAEELVELGY